MDAAAYKALIRKGLGVVTGDPVDLALDDIWSRFDHVADLDLRYNYALIAAAELYLGSTWRNFEVQTDAGQVIHGEQPFEHLLELCKGAESYITGFNARFTSISKVGIMTAQSPLQGALGGPDPNALRYLGVPWGTRRT